MQKFLDGILRFQERQQLLFFTLLAGFLGFCTWMALGTEIQAFPEFTNVQVQVITQYAGKAAEEIERQVTRPVEIVTNGLPGLIGQRSVSIFGLSVVTLTFSDSTVSRQARLDVSQRLNDAELPEGVKASLGPDSTPVGEIFRYTVEGNFPSDEERLWQDWVIERDFKSIQGVADVVTFGGAMRTVEVQLDLARAKNYGVGIPETAEAVIQNHANSGGSPIVHGEESYLVRSLGLYRDPYDLEQAVIATKRELPVKVRDVGEVKLGHRPRNGQVGRNDADDVVEGIILLRQGADTLKTCEEVKKHIDYMNKNVLPEGVQIVPFYDRTQLISKSSHTVTHNVVFGVALVCLLLLVGMGLRYWSLVLAVALIIPFALVIALVGVRLFGLTPNLISLGAVDFGIIVETAIFAAEALILGLKGSPKRDSKLVSRSLAPVLAPALLCAFLLVIAFIPILTLQQVEGRIFRPLGITLVAALVGGQLGAILFLPVFVRWAPSGESDPRKIDRWLLKAAHWLMELNGRWLRFTHLRWAALGGLVAIILMLYMGLGSEFLPNLNEGAIYARATAPKTQSLQAAVELSNSIRDKLREIPEVLDVIGQVGRPDDGTDINGFDNVEVFVVLQPPEKWKTASTLDGMIEACKEKTKNFDGIDFGFSQPIKDNVDEAISGVKGELVLKVFGRDIVTLQKLANRLRDVIASTPGAVDVATEELRGQPELRFQMQRELLSRHGVSVASTQALIEASLLGKTVGRLLDDKNRFIDIVVRPKLSEAPTQSQLEALPLLVRDSNAIPLGEVTQVHLQEGTSRIYREGGERRVSVRASVRGRAVVDVVNDASARIAKEVQLPEGFRMTWAGSFENAKRAASRLAVIVPICFVFIVVLLYSWFHSWPLVGLALWQIPFSLPGGLLGLRLAGLNLSISAAAGGIVLLGVSLLTGIMFLMAWTRLRSAMEALEEAFQGIVLSSGVAIVGLIPAALSHGIGAETARPFAVMILGGLVTSLLCTLFVFPAIVEQTLPSVPHDK